VVSEGVGSHFHVLRARTHFRRCRGSPVPFTCFACLNSFSAVPRASGPVFKFCSSELVFGGTDDVESRFHVLRSRTRFWRYGGRRLLFSCFAPLDSFSAVLSSSGPVFMFCAPNSFSTVPTTSGPVIIFLRSWTRFRRCGGRQVLFSCFAPLDSFSLVLSSSGPVFMFCAPILIFGGTEGALTNFYVLRSQTHFRRYQGIVSRFHVLLSRTRFPWY
jgi:hypothetical protein